MLLEFGIAEGGDGKVSLSLVVEAGELADVLDRLDAHTPDDKEGNEATTEEDQVVLKVLIEALGLCASLCRGGDLFWGLAGSGRSLGGCEGSRGDEEEDGVRHVADVRIKSKICRRCGARRVASVQLERRLAHSGKKRM